MEISPKAAFILSIIATLAVSNKIDTASELSLRLRSNPRMIADTIIKIKSNHSVIDINKFIVQIAQEYLDWAKKELEKTYD